MTLTIKDVEATGSGWYRLPCDGRHPIKHHQYALCSKRDMLERWQRIHPGSRIK